MSDEQLSAALAAGDIETVRRLNAERRSEQVARLEADLAALREAAQAVNDLMTGGVGQVPLYFDDQRCSYRAKTALLGLHVALTWPSVLSWRRADSESREETP